MFRRIRLFFLLFISGIFSIAAHAQSNRLSGKVLNASNEPIPGVSIKIAGQSTGTATDVEGRYSLALQPGKKYTLEVTAIGFVPKSISDVELNTEAGNELVIILEIASKDIEGVTVRATSRRQESTNALLNFQKNNVAVSSGIAADFIRRTPDKNTGEVLRRVSGTSIQDNKFVIIRGLSDRYNSAFINGAQLPSSEPDKKAFSFDVIPSQLIDNIIINKTATPDLTGEFAGGLVQVVTKDIPTSNQLTFGVSLGYNTQSSFKDFTSNKRGNNDWLGFSDRSLPSSYPKQYGAYGNLSLAERIELSKAFPDDVYREQQSNTGPIQSYNLTWANVVKGKGNSSFGSVIGITYRTEKRLYDVQRLMIDNSGDEVFNYQDAQNKYTVNWGAVANFAWTKGKHKIAFKNLFNQLLDDNYYNRTGIFENITDLRLYSSVLNQRSLYAAQLEGTHQVIKDIRFQWNLNYSFNNKQVPDLRVVSYTRDLGSNQPFSLNSRGNNANRFFSNLKDNAFGYNASVSIPYTMWSNKQTLKIGGSATVRLRDFRAIILGFRDPNNSLNQLPFDQIFLRENFRPDGYYFTADLQQPSDHYYGVSALSAGYFMLDNKFSEKVRLVWGSRFEYFEQFLKSNTLSSDKAKLINTDKFDVLPSANLTISPTNKTNLRFSASRTVARPEFREVAGFAFYDFEQLASTAGNDTLKRSSILNGDIRYEYYPKAGELLSIGVFYKNFTDPIELTLSDASGANRRQYEFQNAKKANLIGVEAEFRKSLGFISENSSWLSNLYFNGNVTVIFSKVTLNRFDPSGNKIPSLNRPLQGQSPYLINAGFQYDGRSGTNISLLYNRIGQRLALVGNSIFPDIYEKPRDLVDFQISQKIFNKKGEIRLTVSDILNQDIIVYQNVDKAKAYKESTDYLFTGYKPGITFTLGFTYNLDLKRK
jgi:hypothetical protein